MRGRPPHPALCTAVWLSLFEACPQATLYAVSKPLNSPDGEELVQASISQITVKVQYFLSDSPPAPLFHPLPSIENARFSLSWRSRFEETHAHALSASIDVYECHSPVFGSRELLPDFTMKFARTLGRTPAGSLRFDSCAGNCLAFEQPVDGGLFSGRMDLDAKTAYLDVFVAGYFDPRGAAESAIRELGGSYYRLQPHVRQ